MADGAAIAPALHTAAADPVAAAVHNAAGVPFEARSASGLVCLSTSDTPVVPLPSAAEPPLLDVDTALGRLRRMKRRVCKAAELHQKAATLEPAMVTLTYEREGDWMPRHISEALKRVRQWMARRGHAFRYVWTAELQERGAVHYHVIAWMPRGRGKMAPFWDRQGWWPHGSSRSEWATNPVGYIAKYASKVSSKDRLPCGARMHGSGGFTPDERKQMAHHCRPTWLRQLSQIGQRVTRPKGGGAVLHYACGLARRVASPFVLVARVPGRVVLARRSTEREALRAPLTEWWIQWVTNPSVSTSFAMTTP